MRCLAAFIFLIVALTAYPQLPHSLQFTNYTRANGLPEENINNTVQDSRDFLWIGTREGLIRFDGYSYKTWYADPADSSKFSNNNIILAGEMEKGKLFFLSGPSLWYINIYNHKFEQATRFNKKDLLGVPQQIGTDIWCISDIDSLYITNSKLDVRQSISVRSLYPAITQAGSFRLHYPYALIYATGNPLMYILNYESGKTEKFPIEVTGLDSRSRFFLPFAYDSTIHRLYLSSYFNGVFFLDLKLPVPASVVATRIEMFTDGAIRKGLLLPGNRLMLGSESGLYITDFADYSFFNTLSKLDKPMNSHLILDICHTRDNSYWLSSNNGIMRFSLGEPLIKYWRSELTLEKADEIKEIIKSGNSIYFLSEQKGLFQLDRKTNTVKRLDNSLFYCWSAVQSENNIIITGGGKRLAIYNTLSGKTSNPSFLNSFYTNNTDLVTLVFKSRNGDLWYSINGSGGLVRQPAGTNQFINYTRNKNPPSFSHSYVHTAAQDSDGNIWWGTNKSSYLLKWDAKTETFSEIGVDKLIPMQKSKNGVSGLYIDANNNLWVALDGAGLLRYHITSKTGNYYDINRGLPADAVYGMCADKKNRLWFGTRKGLCCYLPEKDKVISFTAYDGFPEDNFEGKGIFYDKDENLLYVGAKQSIASFNPDSLLFKSTSTNPPVFIDEMLVNGKVYYFTDEKSMHLKTKENNIEFNIASPDYNRNNQLILQYQLKGAGNEWVDLGNKRNVSFTGLSHGKYTFSVRCKYKGTDAWRETDYPFTFSIKTPLLKTTWFRLLLSAITIMLAWLLIRNYYRRKLEKQKALLEKKEAIEKERTRIATDMHDDFGASLSRIKFISEKMQLTQKDDETLNKDLSKISVYSDEMAEKMNEIVWALNQRYDSCADLVSFCRSYASEFLMDKNIKLHFSAVDIPDKKIQGEVRRNIFLVMKEALHNIIKHSGATEAAISFLFKEEIQMIIADNGKGLDSQSIRPFANGLENMKKRMADINGKINISGDKGTSITVSVPI